MGGTLSRALIIGADTGLGRALAFRYARDGYEIVGIAGDKEAGETVRASLVNQGATARYIYADLADVAIQARLLDRLAEAGPYALFAFAADAKLEGPFAASDPAAQRRHLDLNLTAPLLLTRGLLARKLLAPGATLIYICSLSALLGHPGAALDTAAKQGLASYARSLRLALRPEGYQVLTVYPGPLRRPGVEDQEEETGQPTAYPARPHQPGLVADAVFKAAQRRRATLVPGRRNRRAALMARLLPGLAGWRMRRLMR